jgi:hypothetical protein
VGATPAVEGPDAPNVAPILAGLSMRALTRHETKKPRFPYEERGFRVLLMLHETNSWLRGQDLNL